VLEIVAEKTGYPAEMLDLDLDLEADLGIDTVKQAETFAAVRAAFNIPRDENLKLRDFPTLAHVIQFARDRRPGGASKAAEASAAAAVVASFDAVENIPRRVPVPVLRPPLRLCKTTGVNLGAGARVAIMPDRGGVSEVLAEHLQGMGVEVRILEPTPDIDAIAGQVNDWIAENPVSGIYWLPALDDEGTPAGLDDWRQALGVRVKALYSAMRTAYEQFGRQGTFLIAGTRLGGNHGYDAAGATAPMGGAVTGFAKTFKRERREATVKAVDFELACKPEEIAEILIKETLRDTGAVEIGYKGGQRWTITLEEQPASDGQPGLPLNRDSVFVVTGAAGSIVSAITVDLAAASGGTFYLLDLVPEPDPDNTDLQKFVTDREGLKRELASRIQARGERATPALVEKELAALERANAAMTAIRAVRTAGGTAHYFSVDLRDAARVSEIVDEIRRRSGRIDVLLHAAGLERSRFLPDKDEREFNLVFDVKADGWFNLLHAIGDMPLNATVAFSSIAGRFGNAGQADYAAANDLLCKIGSSFRTTRPGTRAITIDWTAWGGIGMATRGSIPKMMEAAGIDMLPPEVGIPWIRRELTAGATRSEVVVAGRLGVLLQEWDEAGGLDVAAIEAGSESRVRSQGPMMGRITGMTLQKGLTIETTLEPALQPFLNDHRIDGTPVLPGVMGIEAFAEAALALLPGWYVESVEDVDFLAPFKFYRDEARTVTVELQLHPDGESLSAACRLIGSRKLPGQSEPQVTTHFTGRVRLTKQAAAPEAATAPAASGPHVDAPAIYQIYFHGPAYQVLEHVWRENGRSIGQIKADLPPNHSPAELETAIMPRLVESCFQTAGVWDIAVNARMGLPQHVERVCAYRMPQDLQTPAYADVSVRADGETFDAQVLDAAGRCLVRLEGYRTVALPAPIDAEPLKALQAVDA
jgi:NAD(P)-dependent dehydrogenase (short-subunit alcohol dehydrogenase family)